MQENHVIMEPLLCIMKQLYFHYYVTVAMFGAWN